MNLSDPWPRSVLKVRVDGVRGKPAADVITFVVETLGDRQWAVCSHETRETWVLLHLPAGRGYNGEVLDAAGDRASFDDVSRLLSAVETASVAKRRGFVLLLDDEEIGGIVDGRPNKILTAEFLGPWRSRLGLDR